MADVAGIPASAPMEDFLIPDRARIGAAVCELVAIDRAQRVSLAVNGPVSTSDVQHVSEAWPDLLAASLSQVPQAASVVEVDLTRVAQHLDGVRDAWSARGIATEYTPYFAEALIAALEKVPQANAAFDAEARGIRRYVGVHLGLSLVGPDGSEARHGVVRDADARNLLGLGLELQTLRQRGVADPSVLSQATVTLADYGPGSALYAVPLVLPGQSIAVRAGAVEERLIAFDRGFGVAPTVYLCASVDHRALDGMDAGSLLNEMKQFLEQYVLEA
jgi:2-oxoisovalerate dehydrogenase E2 component (dihydrolipoyl transacylase)